jgi:hypothetical protein
MFCPKCKAEYREGFQTCSDCNVDLVEVLPSEPVEERRQDEILSELRRQTVWYRRIFMKIKFLKIFSIILQILGLIFLVLIITPFITDFYFSFDKQLQDFSWKVIKVSDSQGTLYQVNENAHVTLVFEGRRKLKILNGDCGIHNFTYKIGYKNSFRTDSYRLIKGCPLWSLESNTYYDVMHVLERVHKYRIDGDTLWLEWYSHGQIVLMRNKSKS